MPETDQRARIVSLGDWVRTALISTGSFGDVLLVAAHNPSQHFERSRLHGIDVGPMKLKLNPDLWLLDVLFYFLKDRLHDGIIVGGDFNYSRLLDDVNRPRGNHEFFDRIADEGFASLHRLFHDEDQQTFHRKNGHAHQLDYLYAGNDIAASVSCCEVIDYSRCSHLSDHAPLVSTLDLGRTARSPNAQESP